MLKQSLPYIIVLVVLAVLFSVFGYPLFKKTNEANKILAENVGKLKQIYSSANLPSSELIASLQKNSDQLKENYEQLRAKLPVSQEQKLPEGVNLPLFYLEELKNMKERLRDRASKENIKISTEDFGLSNALPTLEEAPQLIRDLHITETVVNLLLDSNVLSIDDVLLGAVQNADVYEDFSMDLGVKCDISSLANLLFTLENTDKGFFIIRDFSLSSSTVNREASAASNVADRGMDRTMMPSRARPLNVEPERNINVRLSISLIRWK